MLMREDGFLKSLRSCANVLYDPSSMDEGPSAGLSRPEYATWRSTTIMESWIAPLTAGDAEKAWDLFIERYRRLIFATIRRNGRDHDEVMDVFAHVCEGFRERDFARLRHCAERLEPERPLSTWIVAVVRNLSNDWWRHRHGRKRLSAAAASLSPIQRRIFEYVFVEQRSHVEAYELIVSRDQHELSFGGFLKELSQTYRAIAAGRWGSTIAEFAAFADTPHVDPFEKDLTVAVERHARLTEVMSTLSSEDQLAVQLFVIEGMPAEEVARALGSSGAKSVYNRVYRALAAIRQRLERAGIRGQEDL